MTSAKIAQKILDVIVKPMTTSEMEELSAFFFEEYDFEEMFESEELSSVSGFFKFMHFSSGYTTVQEFVVSLIYLAEGYKKEYRDEMIENVYGALPWRQG